MQYQIVKLGGVVYLPKEKQTRLPRWVSIPLCVLLTVLVGGISFATVMVLHGIREWEVQTVIGAVNIGLWLYVVHCWRRVLFPAPRPMQTVQYEEPQEGVWPPPPKRPT